MCNSGVPGDVQEIKVESYCWKEYVNVDCKWQIEKTRER